MKIDIINKILNKNKLKFLETKLIQAERLLNDTEIQIKNTKEMIEKTIKESTEIIRKNNPIYSDTLYVLGNGPSLKNINFDDLKHKDTFALNLSYKKFEELDFYPTYFGCFDANIIKCHHEKFVSLMNNHRIRKFFFLDEEIDGKQFTEEDHEKFLRINFEEIDFEKIDFNLLDYSFDKFYKLKNGAVIASIIGILLGYKKIKLLGCDANNIKPIPQAIIEDGIIKINETPKHNSNYWFDNYQEKDELFTLLNPQMHNTNAWKILKRYAKLNNVEIKNLNANSQIIYFKHEEF